MNIGDWARRRGQKWHHVDSTAADYVLTRCGRHMDLKTRRGVLEVRDTMPLTRMIGQPQLCKAGCDRPGMVVFNNEDDPTVGQVDPT